MFRTSYSAHTKYRSKEETPVASVGAIQVSVPYSVQLRGMSIPYKRISSLATSHDTRQYMADIRWRTIKQTRNTSFGPRHLELIVSTGTVNEQHENSY